MKKYIKYFALIFLLTLAVGGTSLVKAYTTSLKLVDLKADFLGSPHKTETVWKKTTSAQSVIVTKTTSGRSALINLYNYDKTEDKYYSTGSRWYSVKTGDTQNFDGTADMIPSSEIDMYYLLEAKLSFPWTQVKINGTWVVDK